MPVKAFMHAAAGLVNMLTIAESTPTNDDMNHVITHINGYLQQDDQSRKSKHMP